MAANMLHFLTTAATLFLHIVLRISGCSKSSQYPNFETSNYLHPQERESSISPKFCKPSEDSHYEQNELSKSNFLETSDYSHSGRYEHPNSSKFYETPDILHSGGYEHEHSNTSSFYRTPEHSYNVGQEYPTSLNSTYETSDPSNSGGYEHPNTSSFYGPSEHLYYEEQEHRTSSNSNYKTSDLSHPGGYEHPNTSSFYGTPEHLYYEELEYPTSSNLMTYETSDLSHPGGYEHPNTSSFYGTPEHLYYEEREYPTSSNLTYKTSDLTHPVGYEHPNTSSFYGTPEHLYYEEREYPTLSNSTYKTSDLTHPVGYEHPNTSSFYGTPEHLYYEELEYPTSSNLLTYETSDLSHPGRYEHPNTSSFYGTPEHLYYEEREHPTSSNLTYETSDLSHPGGYEHPNSSNSTYETSDPSHFEGYEFPNSSPYEVLAYETSDHLHNGDNPASNSSTVLCKGKAWPGLPDNFVRCKETSNDEFEGENLELSLTRDECTSYCDGSCGKAYGFLDFWQKKKKDKRMICYKAIIGANFLITRKEPAPIKNKKVARRGGNLPKRKRKELPREDTLCSCGVLYPPSGGIQYFGRCDHQITYNLEGKRPYYGGPVDAPNLNYGDCTKRCDEWSAFVVGKGRSIGLVWCDDNSFTRFTFHRKLRGLCNQANQCFCGNFYHEDISELKHPQKDLELPEKIRLPVPRENNETRAAFEANRDFRNHRWFNVLPLATIEYEHVRESQSNAATVPTTSEERDVENEYFNKLSEQEIRRIMQNEHWTIDEAEYANKLG